MSRILAVSVGLTTVPQQIVETLRVNHDTGFGISAAQQFNRMNGAGPYFDLFARTADKWLACIHRLRKFRPVKKQAIGLQHMRYQVVGEYGQFGNIVKSAVTFAGKGDVKI